MGSARSLGNQVSRYPSLVRREQYHSRTIMITINDCNEMKKYSKSTFKSIIPCEDAQKS